MPDGLKALEAPPRFAEHLTPGLTMRPWKQPWQVCFVPTYVHWTMRPWRMESPFQHVFLLRPFEGVDDEHSMWLYVEWSFLGVVVRLIGHKEREPLFRRVLLEGAMLHFNGSRRLPPPRLGNGLWPLTCVTFVRQVLGLPFRWEVWTPRALWDELIAIGAMPLVDPPQWRT